MANTLQLYFPQLRTRQQVLDEIYAKENLYTLYHSWKEEEREYFLEICTGARGVKMLYDGFFKTIFDPDVVPERLEELLSLLLTQKVKILKVLPNDSSRIAEESSLLIMDIVVQLEDGSIANVECQKLGYAFPGARAACYSADLLLRQYKRVRGERGKKFSYKDIKKVYSIIFYEQSPHPFQTFPESYIHRSKQQTDTGIEIDLLQEFVFISLDNANMICKNKGIENTLEAWIMFLSNDSLEMILELIDTYPEFRPFYDEIYNLCLNMERVMNMFSKELLELDKNTVQYMIDEMQDEINAQKVTIEADKQIIQEQTQTIQKRDAEIALTKKVFKLERSGKTVTEIAKECNVSVEEVNEILK